jgi:hypothetical protein
MAPCDPPAKYYHGNTWFRVSKSGLFHLLSLIASCRNLKWTKEHLFDIILLRQIRYKLRSRIGLILILPNSVTLKF